MKRKHRDQIVADIRRTRDEMRQILTDLDSWNDSSEARKRGEPPITYDDIDPDGSMRRMIAAFDQVLAAEDARPLPPIPGFDVTTGSFKS